MSDVHTEDNERQATSTTPDVQALIGRARDAAEVVRDRSLEAATVVRDRVSDFVGTNESSISNAIERTGGFVDEKLTGQRFSDKIDRAQGALKGAVNKVGNAGEGSAETAAEDSAAGKSSATGTE